MDNLDQLIPVDITTFRKGTRDITFDVYLKLSSSNIAHVFSRTTGLDYRRLAQYIQKGVKELYIKSFDLEAYRLFSSRTAEVIFSDPRTTPEKKVTTLVNMTEQNMTELFTQFNIPDETAEETRKLVNSYVDMMISRPETLTEILKLVSNGDYLYYHSIAVSIFSMFIAKASGQFNKRTLELLGFGGFLHDIGCTQLPKEIVCSPTEFTEDQWKHMHLHPKLGLDMLETAQTIPDEVRYIVYQHHEEPNGNGYPNRLFGTAIYYPARIVAIADGFSALISKRPFRPAYTVPEALRILRNAGTKYDADLIQLLTAVFTPKDIAA